MTSESDGHLSTQSTTRLSPMKLRANIAARLAVIGPAHGGVLGLAPHLTSTIISHLLEDIQR